MKKFNLLLLLVVFSFSLVAQRANMPQAKPFKASKGQIEVTKLPSMKSIETYGDVLFSDDFSSGTATTLPTGWTSVDIDSQGNNFVWKWTDVGATGPTTTGYEHVLASTTATNGWMILDSDLYGQGSYDAILTSPTYDLTGQANVALVFQELYKRWGTESANPYGGNPTFVGISIDGGTTWEDIELHASFATKDETDNPGIIMLNISTLVGNQAAVKVRFRVQGLWDYWWQIDDFKLIVGPENNVEIVNNLVSNMEEYPTGFGFSGCYSKTPLTQDMPVFFQADMWNNGSLPQTNVTMNVEVTNAAGTVLHTAAIDTAELAFNDTFTAATPEADYFIAGTTGVFTANFEATQTQTPDDIPENNVTGPVSWEVWDNNIMARDVFFTLATTPEFYTGGADGDFMGLDYFVRNATSAHSISVLVDYRTTPGNTTMVGQLYGFDTGGARVIKIESEAHVLDTADVGQWVTLPLIPVNEGDELIADQTLLTAGIEFYWGGVGQLWIAADEEGPHIYSLATALRVGPTWYWIASLPFVRLNLDGAILPPRFVTAGDTNACRNQVNQWVINVSDPQGLPVTIEGTTLPTWVTSFTDLGNGWAEMSGTPTTAGKVGNFVELTASNGINENKQYYVINVTTGTDNCRNENAPEGFDGELVPSVEVYPNPTTGQISVTNAERASISVLNMMGAEVASVAKASANQSIDLSGFGAGVYFVKVVSNGQVSTQKINLLK